MLSGRSRRAAPGPRPAPLAALADGPFVGRTDELGRLDAAWRSVSGNGRTQVVCVTGDPGIGKTRLAARARVDRP